MGGGGGGHKIGAYTVFVKEIIQIIVLQTI